VFLVLAATTSIGRAQDCNNNGVPDAVGVSFQ
jgi:hypothetical protein